MDLKNIANVLSIDTSNQFSVNAFLSSIKRISTDAVNKISDFIDGVGNSCVIPFTNGVKTGVLNLTQSAFQSLEDTGEATADIISVGANAVENIKVTTEECCESLSQVTQTNSLLVDISNSISTTASLNDFIQNVNIIENKYVSQGSEYANGIISSLKDYLSSSVEDDNWISSVLTWIADLSGGSIKADQPFDPSDFFDFDEYSDMTPFAAWASSIDFDVNWDNISNKIASACLAVVHGISYIAGKTQELLMKVRSKLRETFVDPKAYFDNDRSGKSTITGLDDRLYTIEFSTHSSSGIVDGWMNDKISAMVAAGFPSLSSMGISSFNNVVGAFDFNYLYHFDFPGCAVSIYKYRTTLGETIVNVTWRPKLYSGKTTWTRDNIAWTYPSTISECIQSVAPVIQRGWDGTIDTSVATTDHVYATAFNNGSIAFAATQLSLIAAATKDHNNYSDDIPASLITFFTQTALPSNPWNIPGFGCPGMSQFAGVNNVTTSNVISTLENQLNYGEYFSRSDNGYSPYYNWYETFWASWPVITLISCYLVKENNTYFVPYIKSNSDISGSVSLMKTSDQAALFKSFAKKIVIAAGLIAAAVVIYKVRRKIVNKSLAASSQYEQFYYKATTSSEDINTLRKMRFKSKVWNTLAGIRVTASDGLPLNTVNTTYAGSSYDFEGDRSELLIKLIMG